MATSITVLPSFQALVDLTGINPASFRSDVFRKRSAAAFGAREPFLRARPLALDAIAIAIRDDLAKVLPRSTAATITRGYFDFWGRAVSHAEHGGEDTRFVIAELEPATFGDSWRAGVGPASKLDAYVATLPTPLRRLVVVDVAGLLATLRARAAKAGIAELRLMVPPDHPIMTEIDREWRQWRETSARPIDNWTGPALGKELRQLVNELRQ